MKKRKRLEKFLEENLDNVYRFAYTYMRRREDAEDVVSESVVKALKGLDKLKDDNAVRSWFYSIVSNTALSALRSRGRCTCDEAELDTLQTEDDHSMLNFESMIKILDEQSKAIIVMKCCDGMTFSEIGGVLRMNENTVKTRFYTALKRLKNDEENERRM